ncbi:MAG: AbrB/MazE/SpoVT family DNA-binding domain-containing protein [Chloroflexota bacterium]|nr:AbrB/MazE/SpoVT family DNA-binding domain-containing protein [Chloroflexota bacterium]
MSDIIGCLTIDPKGRTTLPKELRDALGLSENTLLRVERMDNGSFELVPVELVPRDQIWFRSPDVQGRIEAAEEDFRAGRFTCTSGGVATQRYLDALKQEDYAGPTKR